MNNKLWPLQPQLKLIQDNGCPTIQFFDWLRIVQTTLGQGYTGTITTAKLTVGGTNGSLTFVNGVVTAETPAT